MASFSPAQSLLVVALLLTASFCQIHAINNGDDAVSKFREFDYFNLALQWPGTVCGRSRHCCSSNACCRGSNAPVEFTIHGLWPDYNDGTWPACCTRSEFEEKEITTLLDPLEKVILGSREKHGTCSSPVVRDEYSYFLTTLNVFFKYNVTRVLSEAGYVPSNSEKYPLGGIISAIQNAFHATPKLVCSKGALEELHLCFYKDFQPRDCLAGSGIQNGKYSSKSSCPKYVSLPAYVSPGLDANKATMDF
ncbi:hypothetical protein LWI28_028116 [Acer negundo]|uniref:Uncharacterized protein n=1 Tax=Acer negundo TaxID=4023 RepID=A0AAD5IY39_ACENE|nr:hypothetical protein LWI28_028116 [Acer negundo]KAK4845689.1 hypothetical protein QYF36_007908 [Acer negundo]